MSQENVISIKTQEPETGMVKPLMQELLIHLTKLAEYDETHAIDLQSLPLSTGDLSSLREKLGYGEVSVEIETIGRTELYETQYAGIWWIRHLDTEDKLLAELIEICNVPDLLVSHQDDIAKSAESLAQQYTMKEETTQ